MGGGDYVLVVKFSRGDYFLVAKYMGGGEIMSTSTKMSRGGVSGGCVGGGGPGVCPGGGGYYC